MLRPLRRKLQQIRYYSATSKATPWTRAVDTALVVTLVAAFPFTLLVDLLAVRSVEARAATGRIATDASGEQIVASTREDIAWLIESPHLRHAGEFRISVRERLHGWPLATSVRLMPAQLDLDLLAEPAARSDVALDAEDPIRLAIEEELRRIERTRILEAWSPSADPGGRSIRWFVVAVSGLMWWVILFFGSAIAIQLVRIAYVGRLRRLARQEHDRLSTGKCAACGYDLHGLEFHERCPECGGLV